MKKYCIILFFSILTSNIGSQWISNYSGNAVGNVLLQNAHGNDIAVDNSGFCYITGYVDEGNGSNLLVIKYNSQTGDTVWIRTYNGTANGEDIGNKIAVDNNGNVYVVGTATNITSNVDLVLIKYDYLGSPLWVRSYFTSQVSGEDSGTDIAIDFYGNVYVTGFSTGTDSRSDIITIKYSPDGIRQWSKSFDGDDHLEAKGTSIAVNSSGSGIFIAGYVTSFDQQNDLAIIRYDKYGGKVFSRIYKGLGNESDRAFGIAVDEYNNVYITGYVTVNASSNNTDCITLKYNNWGTLVWQQTLGGESGLDDRAFGIAVDTDGNVYIVGYTTNSSGNSDYLLAAYNPFGYMLYKKNYDGITNGDDKARAIGIVTNQNYSQSIVITGSSWGSDNNFDYATVWFDKTTGDQQYLSRYSMNSQTEDVAMALATSGSSQTYVTGYSELLGNGPTGSSFASTEMLGQLKGMRIITNNNSPYEFSLSQNYPNPFNPTTKISFTLSENSNVKMIVYDITGRVVSTLINGYYKHGSYDVTFTAENLASGVYFYELVSGSSRDIKKMTLIK